MKRIALASFAVVFALSSFGCGRLREKLAHKAVEEGSSGNVTVTTPTGTVQTTSGGGAKLPDGWPSSVPLYPGASVTASMGTPVAKSVVFSTTDSAQKVHDYYKAEVKGMKLATDIDANGSKVMAFRDGGKTVSVTIAQGTQVTISAAAF